MAKWIHAMQIGFEILSDVEAVLAGTQSSFTFSWGGRSFTVTVDPKS